MLPTRGGAKKASAAVVRSAPMLLVDLRTLARIPDRPGLGLAWDADAVRSFAI